MHSNQICYVQIVYEHVQSIWYCECNGTDSQIFANFEIDVAIECNIFVVEGKRTHYILTLYRAHVCRIHLPNMHAHFLGDSN